MSQEFLFDASALIALIQNEKRGAVLLERTGDVPPMIDRAAIHTVQIAEVVKKLGDKGAGEDLCWNWLQMLDLEILTDFNTPEALGTGPLCPKRLKLSLADRIGLAVARARDMVAVTTEEQWKTVADTEPQLGLRVMLLR